MKLLGQGGFGRTLLAEDEYLSSKPRCVVKQFYPFWEHTSAKASQLFQQEAARLAELGYHAQIPKLLAYFEQGDRQYIVQEFIDGDNLAQELQIQGAFREEHIRQLLSDLLPILQFIHQGKIIHRDIKPENIIRRRSDHKLVLVDFGAAKYATATVLAKTGTTIGSAGYAAPEQLQGKALFASDLYSLGVTCIHLLTQIEPFDLYDPFEGTFIWRQFLPDTTISDELGRILDKLIHNRVRERYHSASQVLMALNHLAVINLIPIQPLVPIASSPIRPHSSPVSFPKTWRCLASLEGHQNSVHAIAFSPDGQWLASGSWDKTVKLWNVRTNSEIYTLKGHKDSVYAVDFSPDGQLVASSSLDRTIKLWHVGTGLEMCTLRGHTHSVRSLAFNPDGRILASASWDRTIRLWQLNVGRELAGFRGHTDSIYAIALSPDGQLLASGGADRTLKIWQVMTGIELLNLTGHMGTIRSVAFSPDGEMVASSSWDKTIRLWHVRTGKEICTLKGHFDSVNCVAFSPDGRMLVSSSLDKTVRLWHVRTGREIGILTGYPEAVYATIFSPDGQSLASASADRTITRFGSSIETVEDRERIAECRTLTPLDERLAFQTLS